MKPTLWIDFVRLLYRKLSLWPMNIEQTMSLHLNLLWKFSIDFEYKVQSEGMRSFLLNQSEQSYCCLIGQYFHKSELKVYTFHYLNVANGYERPKAICFSSKYSRQMTLPCYTPRRINLIYSFTNLHIIETEYQG